MFFMKPSLLIVLEGNDGSAVAIARVEDSGMLASAARSVIRTKKALAASTRDISLSFVAREEALRLERTLGELIPDCVTPVM
jgi:hypothetical protein